MIIEEVRLVVKVAENGNMSGNGNPASGWGSRKLDKDYIETTLLNISIPSSMLDTATEAKRNWLKILTLLTLLPIFSFREYR